RQFNELMQEAKDKARQARKKMVVTAVSGQLPETDDSPKYRDLRAEGKVLGWIKANTVIDSGRLDKDAEVALLLDQTNFYAEQGGQVGDIGTIVTATGRFEVDDSQKL